MATEVLTVGHSGIALDLLLFRRFQREVPGLVEKTLAANPGLADFGPFLPVGTQVTVELPAPVSRPTPRRVVRLFS